VRGTGSKFAYITAAAVVAVLIFSGSNIRTIFKLKSEVNRYRDKLENLKEENLILEEEIRLIKTEPEHLEYLARKKLGLIKEGETKYFIIQQTGTVPSH